MVLWTQLGLTLHHSFPTRVETFRFEDYDEIWLNSFFRVFSKIGTPKSFILLSFFLPEILTQLLLLKDVKPSPDRKF